MYAGGSSHGVDGLRFASPVGLTCRACTYGDGEGLQAKRHGSAASSEICAYDLA